MPLQDITITSSIKSLPTLSYGQKTYIASTDDQSFPIETFVGSYTAWPTFVENENYTNNLIVNITQSWSGSNITPLGAVPFFHNTMEEFVNGEFLGTEVEVSDGILTDPDCESLLKASTVPVAYKIFSFFKNPDDFYSSFLNINTIPDGGEIYIAFNNTSPQADGQYAKIAKIDALGNDNTLSLRDLKRFSYIDSNPSPNGSKIIFDIISSAEYSDYFFYGIKTIYTTTNSPFDDNYLDFSLSASYTGSFPGSGIYYLDTNYGNWNIINDSLNGFNSSLGKYTFTDTPNILTYFTASTKVNLNSNANSLVYILQIRDKNSSIPPPSNIVLQLIDQITSPSSGINNLIITGSFPFPIEDYEIYPIIGLTAPPGVNSFTITSSLIITQSSLPSSITNNFNLEPYLTTNFSNTDCDVLMNNASQNDISSFRQRVLYDSGSIIPSNFEQIISGTAELAEVNDYNYNADASIRPRYEGSRILQQELNKWTNEDISYNQTPSVTNLQTYFAYFDFLQNTSYELLNKTAVHIVYLIDKDGTILIPSISSSYYSNLIDNFETDKFAEVIVETENGDKEFLGLKRIIRPGVLPRAILYSQRKAINVIDPKITFQDNTNPIPLIQFKSKIMGGTPNIDYNGDAAPIPYYPTIYGPFPLANNTSYTINTDYVKINISTNLTKISFTLGIYARAYNDVSFSTNTQFIPFYIQKSTNNGISWTTIASKTFSIKKGDNFSWYYLTTPLQDCVENDLYRIQSGKGQYGGIDVFINESSYFKLNQQPNPQDASASYDANANPSDLSKMYWITGSQSSNALTSSQFFPFYNPGNPPIQSASIDDGYGPLLPFTLNKGDQVRFEGDEEQVYTIREAFTGELNVIPTDFNTYTNILVNGVNPSFVLNLNNGLDGTGQSFGQSYSSVLSIPPSITSIKITAQISASAGQKLGITVGNTTPISSNQIITTLSGINTYTFNCTVTNPTGRVYILYGASIGSTNPSELFTGTIDYITVEENNALFVKLYENILQGTNINSFLFRRLQPNPNFVIIDSIPITGSGYLFAQYSTNELKQNFDNIIIDLKERILI